MTFVQDKRISIDSPIFNMYNIYFYVYFLCLLDLQYIQYCLFFCFWFLCLLIGVFNLYSTGYFFLST
jgi:hypothetical protein